MTKNLPVRSSRKHVVVRPMPLAKKQRTHKRKAKQGRKEVVVNPGIVERYVPSLVPKFQPKKTLAAGVRFPPRKLGKIDEPNQQQPKFNMADLPAIKRLYEKAVKNKKAQFKFKGQEFVTDFLRFYIPFLEEGLIDLNKNVEVIGEISRIKNEPQKQVFKELKKEGVFGAMMTNWLETYFK